MRGAGFWMRWSLRDLRRRWLQVVAIALVMAIGVAVFAGLGGLKEFRQQSQLQSFEQARFHDLRVSLAEGEYVRAGEIERAVSRAGVDVVAQQERIAVRTQIDAAPMGRDIVTPGLVIGVPVAADGDVDRLAVHRGAGLTSTSPDRGAAMLDRSYASYYKLPASGTLELSGGNKVRYRGVGQSPQYFLITSESGFGGESTLGVLYMPLAAAQAFAGKPDKVNELVLRLPAGADTAAAAATLKEALAGSLPSASVTTQAEEPVYRIGYKDAGSEQRMFSLFGLLVLLGAGLATFNLVGRNVEAERRELGVGMALGVRTRQLAFRPGMLGAQIAALGTLAGVALAYAFAQGTAAAYKELLPLPVYVEPFTFGVFARGAIVGLIIPIVATVWPVWRAVRVQPVEAIRVSDRAARGGAVRAASRLRLPGGTRAQMPWRNAMRTPRRTFVAVAGLGAVIAVLIALLGVVDSFDATVAESRAEASGAEAGLMNAYLARPESAAGEVARAIAATDGVAASSARIDLAGRLRGISNALSIPVVMSAPAAPEQIWQPTIAQGTPPRRENEVLLAPKAAADMEVEIGDSLLLELPSRQARAQSTSELVVRVTGLTGDPFRAFVYAGPGLATKAGYSGLANQFKVRSEPGTSSAALQRRLAAVSGVALARPSGADAQALKDTVGQFGSIIQFAAFAVLLLAVLMAFNLSSIAIDERRREYATMFAAGLPVSSGLRMAATENLIVGVLATLLGIAIGYLTLGWFVDSLFGETWPEIGLVRHISLATIALALLVGVVAVAITPYLLARRLTRMDIPSTLRVVE